MEITKAIEVNILKLQHQKNKPFLFNNESGRIKIFDARPAYLKQIKSLIDFKTIRKAKLKIAVDCLYGTSRGYLDLLLEEGNLDILVLHNYLNPSFDGRRP